MLKTFQVKKKFIKSKVLEKDIQREVDNYLTVLGVKPIRIPDALFRSIYANSTVRIHIKTQIANSIAGLPDLMIPKLTDKGLLMLPLELKTQTGKLGQKQVKWQKVLGTKVARSFEEARVIIDEFLGGE